VVREMSATISAIQCTILDCSYFVLYYHVGSLRKCYSLVSVHGRRLIHTKQYSRHMSRRQIDICRSYHRKGRAGLPSMLLGLPGLQQGDNDSSYRCYRPVITSPTRIRPSYNLKYPTTTIHHHRASHSTPCNTCC
jgi:hypothetical protein